MQREADAVTPVKVAEAVPEEHGTNTESRPDYPRDDHPRQGLAEGQPGSPQRVHHGQESFRCHEREQKDGHLAGYHSQDTRHLAAGAAAPVQCFSVEDVPHPDILCSDDEEVYTHQEIRG